MISFFVRVDASKIMMTTNENRFSTTDLGLAAALRAIGVPLLRLEPQDGRRIVFVFSDNGMTTAASARYWAGELQVDALGYFNAAKTLKNQLYSLRNV